MIPNKQIPLYLGKLPIGNVWGIGSQTTALLQKFGIHTALDFIKKEEDWVNKYLSKPFQEIWHELSGKSVLLLQIEPRADHHSIQKMKTFTPPSQDRNFVFAQLCKNIESACMRARAYKLEAKKVFILLRTQSFDHQYTEVRLTRPTNFAHELIEILEPVFDTLFRNGTPYRATMVTLVDLQAPNVQPDLFGTSVKVEGFRQLYEKIDEIREKYGKHTIHFGASFLAQHFSQHLGDRGDAPERKEHLLKGETKRKRVGIPTLSVDI